MSRSFEFAAFEEDGFGSEIPVSCVHDPNAGSSISEADDAILELQKGSS